jgi:cytochrome c-type biogenesis protein CcmF
LPWISFFALTHAYVVSDFSVQNVVENSHSLKPMLYKVTGVWGNHEGSMLLWVLILVLFSALVALFGRNLPDTLKANVLSVQAWITVAFLLFVVLTSNPFSALTQLPWKAMTSIRSFRTSVSPSIRRCSISAMSASRFPLPLPSRR